jgi:hypothetical protein
VSTETKHDFAGLNFLATLPCDPENIKWRAEFARLYDSANARELQMQAEIERLTPAEPPATYEQPLLDCAKRLTDLTGASVDVDLSTVHRYNSTGPGRSEVDYSIYTRWSGGAFYHGKTLAEAEANFHKVWEKEHQPIVDMKTSCENEGASVGNMQQERLMNAMLGNHTAAAPAEEESPL